jgi:hypothetical protein
MKKFDDIKMHGTTIKKRDFSIVIFGGFCIAVWSSDPEGQWASCHYLNCIKLEVCPCNTSKLASFRRCDRDLSANVVSGISDVSFENAFTFINT